MRYFYAILTNNSLEQTSGQTRVPFAVQFMNPLAGGSFMPVRILAARQ
jgi:hypothetical protein